MEDIQTLSQLRSATGGTSLITYYIPGDSDMKIPITHFNTELSAAQNIKDKDVREGVKQAIKQSLINLKAYNKYKAPSNGLVLLAGEAKYYV